MSLEAVVVAVIGSSALATVVKFALDRVRLRERGRKAIEEHAVVYDHLTYLRHKISATRVVIVKTSNGGGLPSGKTPLFSSALYEVTSDEAAPIKLFWQQLPVDEPYIRTLRQLMDQGSVRVDAAGLEGGTLAEIYATAKVTRVEKHLLFNDALGVYYLSLQWDQDAPEPNATGRLVIRSSVQKIRAALTK